MKRESQEFGELMKESGHSKNNSEPKLEVYKERHVGASVKTARDKKKHCGTLRTGPLVSREPGQDHNFSVK